MRPRKPGLAPKLAPWQANEGRPVGRVQVFRRYGARWCIVLRRSPPGLVRLGVAAALRRAGEVAVWTPERGSPLLSGTDAETMAAFQASEVGRRALAR